MLGFKEKGPIVLTEEQAEKLLRWMKGEYTPEEIEEQKEVEKRLEEARKKWTVVWKDTSEQM